MALNKHRQSLEEIQDIMLYEMNLLYRKHRDIVNYKSLREVFNCTERHVHFILRGQRGRSKLIEHYKKFKSFYEGIENGRQES